LRDYTCDFPVVRLSKLCFFLKQKLCIFLADSTEKWNEARYRFGTRICITPLQNWDNGMSGGWWQCSGLLRTSHESCWKRLHGGQQTMTTDFDFFGSL
jgi:hypothetical protein